ncbi:carbohydrate ABC transporter permease [Nocardia sp. alder85J]|uniref:carbohydrate ABC transporter permease n=1 Tax=Nocardia sp. alder85J TaxID=2862949 RepID=UPI001CD2BDB4|nr:carbohydrate ABC transporter permease [Nocardia sp. alder85J]MCX4091542.1 carbohydrate ABC transporter permease [Nocardia sp. alder85J]
MIESRRPRRGWAGHLVLGLLGVACVFPIYWMYATSFRRPADVGDASPVPWPLSVQGYRDAAHIIDIGGLLLNTFVVAGLTAAGQLLTSLLAAYALTRWQFRGRQLAYLLFVGTWLVPFQVTMLPNYIVIVQLGLLNTLAGVIVPTLCSAVGIMMLRQHLQAFPRELLEAATMDGRSSWATLWTVVVPNIRAALASLAILLFITSWNEYFWPAMVLRRSRSVIQLGLEGFFSPEGTDWSALMAAAGLACLPVFALYLVLQRQIVSAFVRSGIR